MSVDLIGRDGDLAATRAFLHGPAPAVLLLDGEAGIGKTSLWQAAIEEEDPDAVLIARPTAAEAELSFAALGDLLVDVLEEAFPALPGPQRRALEVALLLTEADDGPPDQRTIGAALLSTLRHLAAERPIVVAIDDVQWLDPASRFALVFCTRRLRNDPVRLLLTARTMGDDQPHELALAMGAERLERRTIGPLSVGAVRSLLQTRLGASLQRPILRRLYETSGGNPFLALELVRELERAHPTLRPGEPLPVPSSLRQLLAGRIERLSPTARRALLAVSAAGKVEEPTLARVGGADGVTGLEEAVAADVLTREGEEIRFSHPLLRSTVYELASRQEKRLVHRRLGELAADVEERARHLALAVDPPDEPVAIALDKAARHAFARGAIEQAAALGEQALRFTDGAGRVELHRRRLAAAGYLARAGSKAHARQVLDTATSAAPTGPQRAEIALAVAWWGLADDATRIELLEQAVEEVHDDAILLARIHAVLAALFEEVDISAGDRHASLAVELAERVGDPGTLAMALTARENVDFHSGRGVNAPRLERAITLERMGANPWGDIGVGRFIRGLELLATGELDAARSAFELLAAEGRSRADAGLADVLVLLADVETRAGNWQQAQDLADEAIEIVRGVDDRATAECLHALGLLAGLRGDVPGAQALMGEGLRLADQVGKPRVIAKLSAALGLLELSRGNAAAARSRLGETARRVAKMRIGEPGVIPFVPDLVEALVGLGELTEAEEATAELEEQGRRLGRRFALAGALRCRGLIAAARGDLEGAVGVLESARDEATLIGQPFELGRTLLALGVVRRRTRQRRRARETLAEAERIFGELGAKLWAEQAHAELARLGGRTSSPTKLTPNEQRIAELVSEGKTNKEVAAILVVADRTVESALTQIYRKLDVRSRTELAHKLGAHS